MKFSEKWLREWADPSVSIDELLEQLTMAGLEVKNCTDAHPGFSGIVVARVESVEPHPNADKLSICSVNAENDKVINVVCGAENIKPGSCYPLAPVGSVVYGGTDIGEIELKGVKSEGMLCSSAELGLSEEDNSLLELDLEATPGQTLDKYLELDDQMIELSLTLNRGDCLCLSGIAREVAVLNELQYKPLSINPVDVVIKNKRKVSLENPISCPRYVGRVIEGIDITKKAPDWMQEKLRRSGVRSINIIVDIANYVMLELGQPMHAFDNDLLNGDISVRNTKVNESLVLLDGKKYQLGEDTLVIADESGAIAMAGIMGGLDSAVSDNTSNIFLESAFFSPDAIMGKARQYGLHTDASHRYERGVDYNIQGLAAERATSLILELCGGKAGSVIEASKQENLPENKQVKFRPAKVYKLLGIELKEARIEQIIEQLDMTVVKDEDCWSVSIPSFRFDIDIEADLVKEVARIYGYDNMPSDDIHAKLRIHSPVSERELDDLRRELVSRGYYEAITYSFVDEGLQKKITGTGDAIHLLNPISSDLGVMRQSLWPGLILVLQYNLKRQQPRIRMFEYGRIFNLCNELIQDPVLSGITCGNLFIEQWDKRNNLCDFYDLKSDVEALILEDTNNLSLNYEEFQHPALHPGQSAQIIFNNQRVGVLGAIHPSLLKELGITTSVFVFELEIQRVLKKVLSSYEKLSKFPSVKRDISIIVDKNIAVANILKSIKSTASELLENFQLFDAYQGEGIDIEKKSLALSLTFRASSSTLRDKEVEKLVSCILGALHSEFGATLRD